MLCLTRVKSASTAVEDGSAPPALSVAIEPGLENTRRTQASTEVPGHFWSSVFLQGKRKICDELVPRLPRLQIAQGMGPR